MTGRSFAERLAGAGLDVLEVPGKTRLFDSVLSAFQDLTGAPPESVTWVPGRLEVFGTHTDYAGGRTLVSALPRGFAFAARLRADGLLRAVDAAAGESMTLDIDAPTPPLTGWRRYVEVVVERLARNFPDARSGADIAFASDLPRAAGMSSSSALMVGVATTLVRLWGIRGRPEWQANIASLLDEASYLACIENGRTFGSLAGDAGVGTHGGSEDHAAMVCGTAGSLSAFAFVPMRHLGNVTLPDEWGVVVAASGVAAEKTGAALESYNRLSGGTAILLDLCRRSDTPSASLAAAFASDDSAAARLEAAVRTARVDGWPPEKLEARLRHFIREDARVPEAMRAFRERDERALAELSADSQSDSESLLGNQVQETVALTRLGLACGAFATRSFGAGFGGSVWALVRREDAEPFVRRWLDAYRLPYPQAPSAVFIAQPAPAVLELLR